MTHALLVRRKEEGYRQRWKLKITNFDRKMTNFSIKMTNFSSKVQSSERRLLKSTGNRKS